MVTTIEKAASKGPMRIKLLCLILFSLTSLGLACAQSSVSGTAASPRQSLPPAPPSLPISYGDLIEVTVFDSPDLTRTLRVNQVGEVELPLGGSLRVKGLTAAEAGRAIAARFKERNILLDPHVSVMIVEYQSQGVTVTGEVRAPGVYPLLTNRTVMDMIALAGGLNENAGKIASVFHRDNPTAVRQVRLNVSVQTTASIKEQDFELLPGDTISVSRSGVIYIVGDVGRPGGFLVEHNDRLSVLQAVSGRRAESNCFPG